MKDCRPRVSVAVPVYNGQRYLRATVDSLLAQTFTDFELIICDNASTDATESICREFAARDSRVKYHRSEVNLGPARNFNRGFELSQGEYFKWNAADDVCAPEFIEKCVQELDADPQVCLAYPRTKVIDENGEINRIYDYEIDYDTGAAGRLRRLMCVNHKVHGAHELYGVMRADMLRKTPLCGQHVRADSVLLARLCMLGRFKRIEEYLFFNRDHNNRSARSVAKQVVRAGSRLSTLVGCGPLPPAEWWDPSLKGKMVFPEWRVWWEYARAIKQAPIPLSQKLPCFGTLAFYTMRHTPKLCRDLAIAMEQILTGLVSAVCSADKPASEQTAPAKTVVRP